MRILPFLHITVHNKPVLPYTPDEISEQISDITELMKQRDKCRQLEVLWKDEKYTFERERSDKAIACAQRALDFMLNRNDKVLLNK